MARKYFSISESGSFELVPELGSQPPVRPAEYVAKARGYWEVISDTQPTEPTITLSDGTELPILWLKPETSLVPTIPAAPIVDVYSRTITVPEGTTSYIYEVDGVPVPRGAETPIKTKPGSVAVVNAIPAPGWTFFSDYQWRFAIPDLSRVTWKAVIDKFTTLPSPDQPLAQRFEGGVYLGGHHLWTGEPPTPRLDTRPYAWVLQGDKVTWDVSVAQGRGANEINRNLFVSALRSPDLEAEFTVSEFHPGRKDALGRGGLSLGALSASSQPGVYRAFYIRTAPNGDCSIGSWHYYDRGGDVHVRNPIGEWRFSTINGVSHLQAPSGEVITAPIRNGFTGTNTPLTAFGLTAHIEPSFGQENTRLVISSLRVGEYA